MTYRVRNIFVAVALAVVAALLTTFYVANYKKHVRAGESSVSVYVASRDVPAGTAGGALVERHLIKTEDVTRRSVIPGAISDPTQVVKLVLTQPLYAGEQVTVRRFSDLAAQGIRAQLKGTMRAIQVPGDSNQVLAGTLHAGDRIDVVGNLRVNPDKEVHAVRIVLRDLLVLQAPEAKPLAAGTAGNDASVLLAVTDTQVQKLYYVIKNADWSLELRPVVDAADSPERVENLNTVLRDGLSQNAINHFLYGGTR